MSPKAEKLEIANVSAFDEKTTDTLKEASHLVQQSDQDPPAVPHSHVPTPNTVPTLETTTPPRNMAVMTVTSPMVTARHTRAQRVHRSLVLVKCAVTITVLRGAEIIPRPLLTVEDARTMVSLHRERDLHQSVQAQLIAVRDAIAVRTVLLNRSPIVSLSSFTELTQKDIVKTR